MLTWQMSFFWQMSFLAIVFLGKCPSGQMSSGQISSWANVFMEKKCAADVFGPIQKGLPDIPKLRVILVL
jgi:hypothetical protein